MIPFEAVPTTSIAGTSSIAWVTRRRITTESSTTRTRIRSPGWSTRFCARCISPPIRSALDSRCGFEAQEFELLDKYVSGEGFHDVFVGSRFERRGHLADLGLRGDHNDDQRRKFGLLTQGSQQLKAVHFGHIPVRENQAEGLWFGREHVQSLQAVTCLANFVAKLFQRAPDDNANCSGIVND